MSKRFIDTNLFSDEWFCDLSKDCKLFFIYFITQCDHAGVLRLNKKLCKFQTGINDIDTVIKDLNNCLITVKEGLLFMPKYLKFQYPNFPKSDVRQQDGAIKILKELNLWDENNNTYLRVSKELSNSYVNDTVIVIDTEPEKNNVLDFPFEKSFELLLIKWFNYKKERKENYKSSTSRESFYKRLFKLSGGVIDKANEIIDYSMANNYAGIFELKSVNKTVPIKEPRQEKYILP